MIKENLIFLHKMIEDKRNLYAILSFLGESIDSMRTYLAEHPPASDRIYKQISSIITDFEELDKMMDEEKFR